MINTAPSGMPGMNGMMGGRTSFGRGGMRPGPMNQQVGIQRPSMPRPITPTLGPGMSVPPMNPPGSVGGPMRLGNPNAPTPDIGGGINTNPSMLGPISGPMNNQQPMNGPMGGMNNLWTNYNKLIGMGSSSMPAGY